MGHIHNGKCGPESSSAPRICISAGVDCTFSPNENDHI
jgi:hypothetical protein